MAFAGSALAVGGNDADTANKVSKDTEKCAKAIVDNSGKYAAKRVAAISKCLDGALKCDEQADAVKADACRAKLIVAGKGACAVGKLDSGDTTIGAGASNGVSKTDKPTLNKELGKLKSAIQKACFDKPADLASLATGLGFTSVPTTADEVLDIVNNGGTGVSCSANATVLRALPIANDVIVALDPNETNQGSIAQALKEGLGGPGLDGCSVAYAGFTQTCDFNDDEICIGGSTPGAPCTIDGDCPNLPGNLGFCAAAAHARVENFIGIPGFVDLIGSSTMACGNLDPNTNVASCMCDTTSIKPFRFPGIGLVCFEARKNLGCDTGELHCGGAAVGEARLDEEIVLNHNIGICSGLCSGGTEDGDLCATSGNLAAFDQCNPFTGDPTTCVTAEACTVAGGSCSGGLDDCANQCEDFCEAQGSGVEYYQSACEGFCVEGPNDGLGCNLDGDCPFGACGGPEAANDDSLCQCWCREEKLNAVALDPGSFDCELGLQIVVEALPNLDQPQICDGVDISLFTPPFCAPVSTSTSTARVDNFQAHAGSGFMLAPPAAVGSPISCDQLRDNNGTGLVIKGHVLFADSQLGDLHSTTNAVCR